MSDRPERRRRWKWARRRVRRATLQETLIPEALPELEKVVPTAGSHAMERAALALCEELGAPAFHDADSRRNPSGLPDLVAVVGSTLIVAEFKPEGRYPDAEQRRWLEALAGVDHIWSGVVRPADWPAFVATLKALAPASYDGRADRGPSRGHLRGVYVIGRGGDGHG